MAKAISPLKIVPGTRRAPAFFSHGGPLDFLSAVSIPETRNASTAAGPPTYQHARPL